MTTIRTFLKTSALAIAVSVAMPTIASAVCLSQAESYEFVKSGRVLPLSKAIRRAGIKGKVVKVALCKTPDTPPRYRLSVIGRGGNLRQVVIPAN